MTTNLGKKEHFTWDPKAVKIRTRSVEKTLEPLVRKVTTLVSKSKRHKKGRSKKAPQLAKDIELATVRLVEVGESIAIDFPEIKEAMLEACKEATVAGESMHGTSRDFAYDPCDPTKRSKMVRAARTLLSSVTRLLCIADMADVFRLLATLNMVEARLQDLQNVQNSDELFTTFKSYGDDLMNLARLTGLRQADLKDPRGKDEMAEARATLKKSSRMLLTASKTYINHPNVQTALSNRNYVMKEVGTAFHTISNVAQAVESSQRHPYEEVGSLADAIAQLLSCFVGVDSYDFKRQNLGVKFEGLVKEISKNSLDLAEQTITHDGKHVGIITECTNLKDASKVVLKCFNKDAPPGDSDLETAKSHLEKTVRNLTKQLNRAIMDHVSDAFLETATPLRLLVEAAKSSNIERVEKYVAKFEEHARKMDEVANVVCCMSDNPEGIKMVKLAARQARMLSPEVVNAACTLATCPQSGDAQENLKVFRDHWIQQVKLLTEAIDDITAIDEFLVVSESRIVDNINLCVEAMQRNDASTLDITSCIVYNHIMRINHVVLAEMENYEPGPFTETVTRAVLFMKNNIIPQFAEHVDIIVEMFMASQWDEIDKTAFVEASRLVHEGMRDIRKAVAMRNPLTDSDSDLESDSDEQETLLSQMADAQMKKREMQAYEQLKAGGKVQFEVHSEAEDDPGCRGISSIVVNGVDYCQKDPGHNVVVLNQVGSVVSTRAYNTTLKKEGIAMARHLEDIPEDHVALIAVQGSTGNGVEAASSALKKLGAVEPINPGSKSSWAFAGYKGNHRNKAWVSQVSRPQYQGPAMISDMINTPAADMGKISVDIDTEGGDGVSSIKINSIERSAMSRGMNVVVLDSAGNYLLSKNFDTADPMHGANEGKRMASFLDELPSERIVCVASQERVGVGMVAASDALSRIGGGGKATHDPNESFAFLGYTGPHKVMWLKETSQGNAPAKIVEFLLTPAAEEEVRTEAALSDYEPGGMAEGLCEEREKSSSDLDDSIGNIAKKSARSLMRALPEDERVKISKLAEGLHLEKNRLITEVNKWDDQGNDIIVLSKKMCRIMMDMSDFTRGTGPLTTTMDVVKAAERIARYGAQLNKLASGIAEMCPHSHTRSDLLAYLQRVALYSHQLTITGRLKADVQLIGGEIIVSGVDSAASLIQAAKNLMNSVILTVKASYIASTKHKQVEKTPTVSWRMQSPEKKQVYRAETYTSSHTVRNTSVSDTINTDDIFEQFQ